MDAKAFNRTVVITPPSAAKTSRRGTPEGKRAEAPRKRELQDIVGGVNISPFISSELDFSPKLASPLDPVGTKYAVLEEFAHGGFSSVSIARDRNLHRLVAIKTLLRKEAENNPALLDAFVSEAKITAQLDHPGIIPIYGLSRDDDASVHLVMKLVDGKTLREHLRNINLNYRMRGIDAFDEDIQLRRRLECFLRVCDTISYAHHRQVVHRDLKPENIMIGKFMEVYVMDWGLARVITEAEPDQRPETISGTPRYFAPEVLRKEPLDLRSDIFTLGLILQEIVTLQYAVSGADDGELLAHILDGHLNPIEHLYHRKIDSALQAIIRKATEYEPQNRYQTVDDLVEDLRRHMGGFAVSAKPDTLWQRLLRRLFGHRR